MKKLLLLCSLLLLCGCASLNGATRDSDDIAFQQRTIVEKTRAELLKSAKKGDGEAAYRLATTYYLEALNDPKAEQLYLQWLEKSADLNNKKAMYVLYFYYYDADPEKSIHWGKLLAESDRGEEKIFEDSTYGDIQYSVGFQYAKLPARETEWFNKYAPGWEAQRLNDLAICYQYGLYGLPQNLAAAAHWYEAAMEKGSVEAMTNLGVVYILQSSPVSEYRNTAKGFELAMKAALKGDSRGMCVVGEAYQWGVGTAKDLKKARAWYAKSDQAGYIPGSYYLAMMMGEGLGGARNQKAALAIFSKLAQSTDRLGRMLAYYRLGEAYFHGLGVARDYRQAFDFYKQGAENGSQQSMYMLAYMYEHGLVVRRDVEKAAALYKESMAPTEDNRLSLRMDVSLSGRDLVAEHDRMAMKALNHLYAR